MYAPTSDHADCEVKEFYTVTRFTIICGDFNAKNGRNIEDAETSLGNFGLGIRNKRGTTLLGFILEKNLFQMNSFFYKKDHRRWTWQSPDGNKYSIFSFIKVVGWPCNNFFKFLLLEWINVGSRIHLFPEVDIY